MIQYKVLYPLERHPDTFVVEAGRKRRVLVLLPAEVREGPQAGIAEALDARRALSHPLLPRPLGVGWRGRRPGLLFAERPSLPLRRLAGGPGGADPIVSMAAELADLLCYLHLRGHRVGYLTPSRLLGRSPDDFTVAVPFPASATPPPDSHEIVYCCPEGLAEGRWSPAGDVYTLGRLLYRLFTGRRPLVEQDATAIWSKQLTTRPVGLRHLVPELPGGLPELIESMIDRREGRRPAPREVLAELRRAGAGAGRCPELSAPTQGRRAELDKLAAICSETAARRSCQALVFRGAEGVGKTRLVESLADLAAAHRIPVLRCSVNGSSVSLHSLPGASPPRRMLRALGRRGKFGLTFSELPALTANGPVLILFPAATPPGRQVAIAEEIRRYQPWALIVLEWRSRWPDVQEQRAVESSFPAEFLEVAPLSESALSDLARAALGRPPDAHPEALARLGRLGRPLDWHLLARKLAAADRLQYDSGAWSLDAAGDATEAPETVVRRLTRRLALLTPGARRLLEALAVVEDPQGLDFLRRVCGVSPRQLEVLIEELESHRFVTASGKLRQSRFGISHRWIRRVVEAGLSPARNRVRHRHAAQAFAQIAESPGADPAVLAPVIVRHRIRAGLSPQPWLLQAARSLKATRRFRAASQLFKEAFESDVIDSGEGELVSEYVELLLLAGQLKECGRLINRLLAADGTPAPRRARLYRLLGRLHLVRGERRRAIAAFEHALSHGPSEASLALELKCELLCLSAVSREGGRRKVLRRELRQLAGNLHSPPEKLWHALFVDAFFGPDGDVKSAVRYGTRTVQALCEGGDPVRLLGRIFNLSHSLLDTGWVETGKRLARYLEREARRTGNGELIAYSSTNRLMGWRRQGRHRRVLEFVAEEDGRDTAGNGNPHLCVERQLNRIQALVQLLRLDEADRLLARMEETGDIGFRPSAFETSLLRGWWCWQAGHAAEAFARAQELAPARPHHFYGRAWLLAARSVVEHDPEAAARAARRALRAFGGQAPYHQIRALVELADAFEAMGRRDEARERLEEALEILPIGRYPPLGAALLQRLAAADRRRGDLPRARARCLRALQVARDVERPLLQAALRVELARIEHEQGQRRNGAAHLDEAISSIRTAASGLSRRLRADFTKRRLNPLLVLSWRLFRSQRDLPADLLAGLSRFARGESDPSGTARELVDTIRAALPGAAVRLDVDAGSGRFQPAAGSGRLSAGKLIEEVASRPEEPLVTRVVGDRTVCGLPVVRGGSLLGVIQLETADDVLETELDFLSCLARLTALRLPPRRRSAVPAGGRSSGVISLSEGRVLVVESPEMSELVETVRQIASSAAAVIVEGESGTGKELVSRAIHNESPRRRAPFVAVNCAAIPTELIENELFGNLEGSFTGARGKIGLVEAAAGGTLFLDEIGSMPKQLQSRLLRVLQEGTVRRIGDHQERRVEVRVVAATHDDLQAQVARGLFREDLFHRLNVFHLKVPPLRDRPSDILPLARHFLSRLNRAHARNVGLSGGASRTLESYHFPGNVRELQNLIESLFHTSATDVIGAAQISGRLERGRGPLAGSNRVEAMLNELVTTRRNFWEVVRKPFLDRDLSRREVRSVVAAGLAACDGNYRRLTEHFGLPAEDYKRFLNFLRDHRCRVDFRPYRERSRR